MSDATTNIEALRYRRELYWRKRLRRLRFGAEPLSEQVAKYRRVTVVLTAIVSVVALLFLLIFSAFRRPDVALVLDAVIFAPIVLLSWLDLRRLVRDVESYEREREIPVPDPRSSDHPDGR
jgi:hypothetical protein